MAEINTPRISPIAPNREASPRRITQSLTFPLTSAISSKLSKFSTLKEKILSPSDVNPPKRANTLRNTARRLSGTRKRTESLESVPGRRNEVGYAERSLESDSPTPERESESPTRTLASSIANLDIETDTLTHPSNYVPDALVNGLNMMRVTHRKRGLRMFRINPQTFELSWDSKTSSRCSIDSIQDIREGDEAKYYRDNLKVSSSLAPRWATILYNDQKDDRSKRRQLHVIAQSLEDFHLFLNTLRRLALYRQAISRIPGLPQDALLADWTKYASPDLKIKEECITIEGVQEILRKYYIYCPQTYLRKKFAEVNTDGSGRLTFSNFRKLVQMLKVRPEIQSIFKAISDMVFPQSKAEGISRVALLEFCTKVQKLALNPEDIVEHIFERYSLVEGDSSGITVEGFSELLMSDNYMPLITPPKEDLTQPLSEYFISSSHNTYLVGRQLAGESSIEPYIQVLEDGCRCIEIDTWDGDDGPVVNHGRTFTSSVSFLSVIDTINHYAFRASSLPVILSLEVHCNTENQHKMVDIMKEKFGDKMVTEPLFKDCYVLPSPADLEYRILIKVKVGTKRLDQKVGSGSSSQTAISSSQGIVFTNSSDGGSGSTATSTSTTEGSYSELEESVMVDQAVKLNRADAAKCNISAKLGDLGVYAQGMKFRNFALPNSKTPYHVFSFSEDKMNALITDEERERQLVKHNKKYLLRVYPSGYRFTSSNYDPIPYWKRGAQMVSLNWQTYGKFEYEKSIIMSNH